MEVLSSGWLHSDARSVEPTDVDDGRRIGDVASSSERRFRRRRGDGYGGEGYASKS